jgi:hypothetical protein
MRMILIGILISVLIMAHRPYMRMRIILIIVTVSAMLVSAHYHISVCSLLCV